MVGTGEDRERSGELRRIYRTALQLDLRCPSAMSQKVHSDP